MSITFMNRAKVALTALAATAALALGMAAMPANANAYEYQPDGSGTSIYYLDKGDKVDLNEHSADDDVIIILRGNATVKSDITTHEGVYVSSEGATNHFTLTVNGCITAQTLSAGAIEGQPYGGCKLNVVNSGKHGEAGIHVYGDMVANYAEITSSGLTGIKVQGNLYSLFSDVIGNGTDKTYGRGIMIYGKVYSENSVIKGTGYRYGLAATNATLTRTTLYGKSTRTTTLPSGAMVCGLEVPETIEADEGSIIKGYAYAGTKSFSSTEPRSIAINVNVLLAENSTIYAYNKGKYGIGIKSNHLVSTAASNDDSTSVRGSLKAYAKNYGVGILMTDNQPDQWLDMIGTDAIIYGGKYGIYSKSTHIYANNSNLKVYAKNLSGKRTGHGIYAKEATVQLYNSYVLVYAKNSKSYYGIYTTSTANNSFLLAQGNSTVKVYGYNSKAFLYKTDGAVTKGSVFQATLYINGKKQTKYPTTVPF